MLSPFLVTPSWPVRHPEGIDFNPVRKEHLTCLVTCLAQMSYTLHRIVVEYYQQSLVACISIASMI